MDTPTRRVALAAGLAATLARTASAQPAPAQGAEAPVRLFRVVGARDEVTIGFTPADLDAMGAGPDVERIARKLVSDGQVTAWQYAVGRAPDGSTRFAATRRVAVLRNDATRVEPYAASLLVAAPPAN